MVPPIESPHYTVREKITVGDASFWLDRPALVRDKPDQPEDRYPFVDESAPPEWAMIWPAGRMLAQTILSETWPPGKTCLEIGCGLGLVGIAALSRGFKVTFTDFETVATELAAHNAKLNGLEEFASDSFDWARPPKELKAWLVVGSDVTYLPRNHERLVALLDSVMEQDGVALIADPNRLQTPAFLELLCAAGWKYDQQPTSTNVPEGGEVPGTIYRITRPSHTPS